MGSETWRDEAQALNQKRNVFVEKYRMPVYTDLKRPDEIEYAMETQLLGAPKENYAGMTDLKKPVSQIAKEAAAKVPWHRLSQVTQDSVGMPSWLRDNQFMRSIKANLTEMARQVGAQALTQGNMISSLAGIPQRSEHISQALKELSDPNARPDTVLGNAQGVKNVLSGSVQNPLQFDPEDEDFKEKTALWEKNQKRIDEFNQRVKIITDDFLQRAGLARTEEDGWLYDAGSIGSSMLSCFALIVLFRNPTVLAGLYGASEAQGVYEDAVAAGIEPAKAYGLGSIAGGANALLEEIGGEYVLQMVNAKGLISRGVAKALAKSGKNAAVTTAALGAMRGGTVEGIEEALQSVATDLIENMGGVQQKDVLPILQDAVKAGIMGSIGGMFGSGPAAYGNYIKYQRHIQTSLENVGVPAETAEVLAREVANEATGKELSGRVLDAIESETDSPFTADERDAQAFGKAFTEAQSREIDRTAWQVGDKVEQQSLQVGMKPELAKANGQVAQTLVNNMYRIAQLTPKEFEAYKIEVINEGQQSSVQEQYAQTFTQGMVYDQNGQADINSPTFKKWFGNSQVVDENGQPLEVYHGTVQGFDEFSKDKRGSLTRSDSAKAGFWFGANKDTAQSYANFAYDDLLSRQKTAANTGKWNEYDTLTEMVSQANANGKVMSVYLSLQRPYIFDAKGQVWNKELDKQIAQKIRKAEYDGAIIYNLVDNADNSKNNKPSTHYMVKNPTQIKSVYNKGTFDGNDANIYNQTQAQEIFQPEQGVQSMFKQEVKKVLADDSISKGHRLDMGRIPRLYVELGLPDSPLKTNKMTLLKAVGKEGKNPHNVPMRVLEELPKLVADPKAVFKSSKDSMNPDGYVVVLDAANDEGKPIVAILSPSEKDSGFVFIPSVYDKDNFENFVSKTAAEDGVVYIKDKGSDVWGPLQLRPRHNQNLINSIKTKEQIVKGAFEKYNQNGEGLRGQVRIDNNAREAIIRIFEGNYDPSTVVHELAHVYLSMLHNASKVSEAPEFVELMQDLHQWLGEPTERGYSVEQQEKFARAFEAYLAEGEAPNAKLQSVFEKFAQWLAEVYDSIKDYFELTPEVKSLFDRLVTVSEPVTLSNLAENQENAKAFVEKLQQGKVEGDISLEDVKVLVEVYNQRIPKDEAGKEVYLKNLQAADAITGGVKKAEALKRTIAQLEEKGYRVVSARDLEMLEKKKAQLDKMAEPILSLDSKKEMNGRSEEQFKEDMLNALKNLRHHKVYNASLEGKIEIRASSIKKYRSFFADPKKHLLVPHLENVLSKAEFHKEKPYNQKEDPNIRAYYKSDVRFDIDNEPYNLHLTVKEDAQGNFFWDAQVQENGSATVSATNPSVADPKKRALTTPATNPGALGPINSLTNQDPFVKGARQIKEEVLRELDKRSLENKAEIKGFLEKAHTPKQIRKAVGDVLEYVERAYAKTEEGKQEHSKLEIPHTDYDALKVKILKDLNRINTEQADKLKEARETVQRLNRIQHRNIALNSEEDAALKKAYQTIRNTLNKPYQKTVAAALQGIAHLPAADKGKFIRTFIASSYVDQVPFHVDGILRRAKEIEEKNYKKYMEGKIKDLLEMKLFSKNGTLRTANLDQESTAAMLELRRAALLTEDEATNELAARHEKYTDKLPSPVDKIINGLLSIRSEGIEDAPMEVYKAVYDGIAQIRKAGRDSVALQKMIRDFRTERDIKEVEEAVSKNKEAGTAKKVYARYIANWESILDLVTSKDLKEKYSMLNSEADAQVYFHKRKTAIMDRVKKFYGITSNWDLQKKINDLLTEDITVTNYSHVDRNPDPAAIRKGGKPFEETLTKMQVLNLYIWSKNPTLNARLETSYGQAQLKNLFKCMLDEKDRMVGDLLQREAENTYGLINEVFIRERGYALPRVWNYFPSVTERVESDIDFLAAAATMAKNPSFIKNRVDSRLIQMKPGNPFSLLFRHIERAADYHYKAEKFNQIRRVFKNGRVKQIVTERFGEDIYDQMIKMIDQMSVQQAKVRYDIDKIGDKLTNNFVKSAIGLRPAITIKQLISSINYSENMPAHAWTAGFIKAVLHPKETIAFMTSGDPYIKTRFESGGMNEAVSHIMASAQAAGKRGRIRTFLDAVTTINTRLGDVGAITFGGRPYVEYLMNERGMTKEQAFEEFRKSTLRSQQAGSKSSLSAYQAMDMNFLTRALFAFKNTPAQYARKIADAMIEYQRGEITAGQLGKNVAIYGLLNSWLYETLTSLGILRYLFGDPDDALEDLADEFLFGPFTQMAGALPLLDTAVNTATDFIKSKVKDEDFHFKQQNLPIVGDLINLGNRALKEDMELEEILDLLAEAGQYGTGLPLRYIKTVPYAAADVAQGQGLRGFLELLGYTRNRARKVTDSED